MLCLRFSLHFLSVFFSGNSSTANIEYYLLFKSNTLVLVWQEHIIAINYKYYKQTCILLLCFFQKFLRY